MELHYRTESVKLILRYPYEGPHGVRRQQDRQGPGPVAADRQRYRQEINESHERRKSAEGSANHSRNKDRTNKGVDPCVGCEDADG